MKTILRTEEPETIKCEICLGQIPSGGGISIESDDYVFHYCGIACYQR